MLFAFDSLPFFRDHVSGEGFSPVTVFCRRKQRLNIGESLAPTRTHAFTPTIG